MGDEVLLNTEFNIIRCNHDLSEFNRIEIPQTKRFSLTWVLILNS